MHWFDPGRALPEIARLLRPGGVFAGLRLRLAAVHRLGDRRRLGRGRRPGRRGCRPSAGCCRRTPARTTWTRMPAQRAVPARRRDRRARARAGRRRAAGRPRAQRDRRHVAGFLADGLTEDELGVTALREVAAGGCPGRVTWWWTYRVRLGARCALGSCHQATVIRGKHSIECGRSHEPTARPGSDGGQSGGRRRPVQVGRAVQHHAQHDDGHDRRLDRDHRDARHLPRHPPEPARRPATSATCCG